MPFLSNFLFKVAPFSPWIVGYSLEEVMDRQRAAGIDLPIPQRAVNLLSVLKDMRGIPPLSLYFYFLNMATNLFLTTASTIEGIFRLTFTPLFLQTLSSQFLQISIKRLSAEASKVGQLRVAVENGTFSPQKWNAHEVACVFKLWLAELPEPIINDKL